MADSSFEEASRCPFCQTPCKQVAVQPLPQGGKIYTFQCDNERCVDWQGRRAVQTNPDGSLAQRTQGPKAFERLNHSSVQAQMARDHLKYLSIRAQYPKASEEEILRLLDRS